MKSTEAGATTRSLAVPKWVTLIFAAVVSGCGLATQENLSPCSGSYAGTYSGAGGGTVTGSLTADGTLALSFMPTATGSTGFSYQVTGVRGDYIGHNSNDVSASFDLGSCRISGVWAFNGQSGVWSVSIQRP
jgi:hypothetical protein